MESYISYTLVTLGIIWFILWRILNFWEGKKFEVKFPNVLTWQGTISRAAYLFWGLGLFFFKHNLDRLIFLSTYNDHGNIPWAFFDYLYPFRHLGSKSLSTLDIQFFLRLFLIAIPFIWIGVGLTIQRLRCLRLPLGLSSLFFVPFVNFGLFLFLCACRDPQEGSYPVSAANSGPFRYFRQVLIDLFRSVLWEARWPLY